MQIVAPPDDGAGADETVDASGLVAMAGGIDIHSHIAGANVNTARLMLPEQHRAHARRPAATPLSEVGWSTFETGRLYAQMGFTTVVEPAVAPHHALHAHLELADTPIIDKAILAILGNDDFVLGLMRSGEGATAIRDHVAWILETTRALGIKVVNAGGVAAFKENVRSFSFDDVVPSYGVTSRQIVKALQRAVHETGVPHPLHVHCNNLGLPGNVETALATIAAADDLPLHLAHLQFYGYGKEGPQGFSSAAPRLAEAVNAAKTVTIDVGQVMFGQTVTISSDVSRQFSARGQARPKKYAIIDGDSNGGGIVPYEYRAGSFHNAVQFAVGLELFLLIDDPWRVFFTTDHPNGAPFTTYPEIFALLMDKDLRAQWLSRLPAEAMAVTTLPSLKREYTLNEIATMTRAAPAKLLGLPDRGHLGVRRARRCRALSPRQGYCANVPRGGARLQGRRSRRARWRGDAHAVWPRAAGDARGRSFDATANEGILRRALRAPVRFHARARWRRRPAAPVRGRRMRALTVNGVAIDDTFAEAFDMRATAIVITAPTARWAAQAAVTMTGFATSVIACGCEAGLERVLTPRETPDGRPGVRVLLFAVSTAELQRQLINRVGQCVLTSPGSACYAGIDAGEDKLKLGAAIRFFGDGWQIAKRLGARRYWRVPVMDGEFVCESTTHMTKSAVGGGNLIVMGASAAKTLAATEAAVKAMREVGDVIMPFPGGIARSGSKVGSKYKGASASTNDAYCPTLKGAVASALGPEIASVLEIVIDGLASAAVAEAMRAGLAAIVQLGPDRGALRVGAGNYGGKLGRHHYHLKDLLP